MADCLLDLVLRPGEAGPAPVQVALTVVAPVGALLGGDAPCEVDGQVVPAEVVRALLATLTGHRVDTATGTTTTGTSTDGEHAGTGLAPSDDDVSLYWETQEQAELEAWWARMERRVLAGEFDAEPPPCYVDDEPPDCLSGPPPDPGDDPPLHIPTDATAPGETTAPDGWWARADRAVDDAGTALLAAQQAIGRARRLVGTAERADAADEAARARSAAGRVTAAGDVLAQLAAATDTARHDLAALLGRTGGGGLADRPRIAVTDVLTGALVSLTDLPALRRADRAGTGLGAPGQSPGYRPSAALDRFVRARDRRCRFPGCRRPVPRGGELDHHTPWPAGPTAAANLAGYCTGHHRGKHQAPGWRHALAPDGTLTVTTPSGLTAATTPPPY
jgi:hypothetical protein